MFSGSVASKSKHGIYGLGWSLRLGGCTPLMLARRGTGGSRDTGLKNRLSMRISYPGGPWRTHLIQGRIISLERLERAGRFSGFGRDDSAGRRRRGAFGGDLDCAGVGRVSGVDGGRRGRGAPDTRAGDPGSGRSGHHVATDERVRGLEEDAGAERRSGGVAHGKEPVGGQGGGVGARGG